MINLKADSIQNVLYNTLRFITSLFLPFLSNLHLKKSLEHIDIALNDKYIDVVDKVVLTIGVKMFFGKMTKMGIAVALFGLMGLSACSENDCVSSVSETDSGATIVLGSIADLDTSLVQRKVFEGSSCGTLAKVAIADDVDETDSDSVDFFVRSTCGVNRDIYLYMNARVRVVDGAGNPVVGANVYKDMCVEGEDDCRYTTDEYGYVYIDSVNYLTFWQNAVFFNNPKLDYRPHYEKLHLRALSGDLSLGNNIKADFSKAKAVKVGGKLYAELENIVLEPVSTGRVYLDSLFEMIEICKAAGPETYVDRWYYDLKNVVEKHGFLICVDKVQDESLDEEDDRASSFYPCQMVTEEDRKKGYADIYGLPEGSYTYTIGHPFNHVTRYDVFLVNKTE